MRKTKKFLDEIFTKSNALSFLRLFFALLVVVSHAYPLGGFGTEPVIFGMSLGGLAVAGFFTISGFLITNSRVNQPTKVYFLRRTLRIYPGYIVALFVTAFALAPYIALRGGSWNLAMSIEYFARGSLIIFGQPTALRSSVSELPYNAGINGSLWTLQPELIAYIALGVLYLNRKIMSAKITHLVLFVVLATVIELSNVSHFSILHSEAWIAVRPALVLWLYFLGGNIIFHFRKQIQSDRRYLILGFAGLLFGCATETLESFGAIALSLCILWLGSSLPNILHTIGIKNDYSYGIYVYAFPIQQLLSSLGMNAFGYLNYLLLTFAILSPAAILSWFCIEKPAINLGKK